MCGIAGIISSDPLRVNSTALKKMSDALVHRGPDGEGLWINEKNNAGFSHRRLSIIDLSETGAQPMHYLERYTIVYNGEIYNYLELKKDLAKAGYTFYSTSDTEVILAAYDCYRERCLQYFDGMFAFAIWDEKLQQLFAARDRFGEKPFYYHNSDRHFSFASEMKGLWANGAAKQIDDKMLLNYLTIGYVQNPTDKSQTFFRNISLLKPAHYLLLDATTYNFNLVSYWDIDKQVSQKYTEAQALHKLEHLFTTSVHKRLRSDVPVGASISGGLDSSSIIYFIKNHLERKKIHTDFKTFSAVFPGFEKDESAFIKEITEKFSITNYQVTPTAEGLIAEFEKMAYHQEEPFPSSSIFAQYKVFELAKQNGVKVIMDGQGADEILAGYHKYAHWYLQEIVSRSKFLRAKKERHLLLKNNINPKWGIKNILAAFLPSHASIALENSEYKRILYNEEISLSLLSNLKGREWEGIHKPIITKLNDILYFNTMCNGLEELLRYADRNSMAHSVEVRLPFLNAELVQFIFSLPASFKIQKGYPKWILRKLMQDKLPGKIVWRTDKIGYEPPQKNWMENPHMKEYMHEAKKTLVKENILKPAMLNKKIRPQDAHEGDNFDWRYLCAAQLLKK
ncbi:MAG: asparagine synthase (glutamine-hydrolyzing) [Ferruginibacter sp.]